MELAAELGYTTAQMAHLNIRPHHKTAFVVGVALHFLLIRSSLGLYLPVSMDLIGVVGVGRPLHA